MRRCSKADNYDAQSRTVAKYLMEMSLINEYYLAVSPSLLAASALYLARVMLYGHDNDDVWNANLEHYSGYAESDMKQCVLQMCHDAEHVVERGHIAIYNKYAASKFLSASQFADDWAYTNKATKNYGLFAPDDKENKQ